MEKKSTRWGIIGCGSVTERKSVPAYQQTEGFEVLMVMGRKPEKVEDYALRHHIPQWTTNAEHLIENPDIDAVYIATPPDSHKLYALLVAKAGKACCLEKPMATNYQESVEIFKAFQERNLPLFIAYYRRSLPRFLKVKEWLEADSIGTVRHIHWIKTKPPNAMDLNGEYNWRTDAEIAPAGYFDDLASHGLDLFTFLLGAIEKVQGFARNQGGLYSSFDSITASWVHKKGITGTGSWNFLTHHREDSVEIFGSDGKITFSVLDEAPIVLENPSGKEILEIPHPKHVQKYHVENIRKHLVGDGIHPSLGKSGLHTSWVMDAILGKL